MQIKKCPSCKHINLIKNNICEECGADITFIQYEDIDLNQNTEYRKEELFARCPGCGTIVPIEKIGDTVRCTEITCQKKFRVIGEDQVIHGKIADNNVSDVESIDDKGIKHIILNNLIDHKFLKCVPGKHILGANGNIDPIYFRTLSYVSGHHLTLEITDNNVYVTDTSRNHTYIGSRSSENMIPYNTTREIRDGEILVLADQPFEVKFCR